MVPCSPSAHTGLIEFRYQGRCSLDGRSWTIAGAVPSMSTGGVRLGALDGRVKMLPARWDRSRPHLKMETTKLGKRLACNVDCTRVWNRPIHMGENRV